jgi:hypothetical protein
MQRGEKWGVARRKEAENLVSSLLTHVTIYFELFSLLFMFDLI